MNEHDATEIAFKNGYKKGVEDTTRALDLVKVVRCRDCRLYDGLYCNQWRIVSLDNGYCHYGERRADNGCKED